MKAEFKVESVESDYAHSRLQLSSVLDTEFKPIKKNASRLCIPIHGVTVNSKDPLAFMDLYYGDIVEVSIAKVTK